MSTPRANMKNPETILNASEWGREETNEDDTISGSATPAKLSAKMQAKLRDSVNRYNGAQGSRSAGVANNSPSPQYKSVSDLASESHSETRMSLQNIFAATVEDNRQREGMLKTAIERGYQLALLGLVFALVYGNFLMLLDFVNPVGYTLLAITSVITAGALTVEKTAIPQWFPLSEAILALLTADLALVCLLFLDDANASASFVTLGLIVAVAGPVSFVALTCKDEAIELQHHVQQITSKASSDVGALIGTVRSTRQYERFMEAVEPLGLVTDADVVEFAANKAELQRMLNEAGTAVSERALTFFGSAVSFLGSLGSLLGDSLVFLSVLYYLLAYQQALERELERLVPIPIKDARMIGRTVHRNVREMFASVGLVIGLHFTVSYGLFSVTGMIAPMLLATLCGVLALIPVISSWIIWVPAVLLHYAVTGRTLDAVIIVVGELVVGYVASYSFLLMKESHYYVVGMSLVAGFGRYGSIGVLLGPALCTGLMILRNIVLAYRRTEFTPRRGFSGPINPATASPHHHHDSHGHSDKK
eukprot:Clim_evm24s218 gene=Clim_evmTU24s218